MPAPRWQRAQAAAPSVKLYGILTARARWSAALKPLDQDAQGQADALPNRAAEDELRERQAQHFDAALPPTAANASEAFSLANNPGLTVPPWQPSAALSAAKSAWMIGGVSAG